MRIARTLSGIAALAALFAPASASAAGRHPHRSRTVASRRQSAPPRTVAATTTPAPDDFDLAVVSAVLPYSDVAGPATITLVVENRGTIAAPISSISVAPRNHLASASRATIHALAPGERMTIEVPVNFSDANDCVSITLDPNPPPAIAPQFYAAADFDVSDAYGDR